jgi:hypothetical protein
MIETPTEGTPTGVRDRVAEAQRKILVDLEACEVAVSGLYAMYAAHLPQMAEFWSGMAHEERGHALLLHSLHRILDRKCVFQEIGRFDATAFAQCHNRVRSAMESVDAGELTPERATRAALTCEMTFVESQFFNIVTSDAPEFQMIATHLAEASRAHARLIEEKLRQLRGDVAPVPAKEEPAPVGLPPSATTHVAPAGPVEASPTTKWLG